MCITNICSTTTWTHRNFRHRTINTMAFFTCCHFRRSHLFIFLVQLRKFKIIRIAACFLIIESIDAHVGFLHLLGSIVKRGGGVLHGCYCHYHIGSEDSTVRAFKALRLYLKYLAHKHSVFKFIIYNCSCFSAETANHLLSRGKDYANERNESLLSNCRVQLIFCKVKKNLRTKQVHNGP